MCSSDLISRAQQAIRATENRISRPVADDDIIPNGLNDPEVTLVSQRTLLSDLVRERRVMWDYLAIQTGAARTDQVAPMVARTTSTFDFSDGTLYSFDGGRTSIDVFINGMENTGLIGEAAVTALVRTLPDQFSGRELYSALTERAMIGDGYASDPVDARLRLTEYLQFRGYDSIKAGEDTLVVFNPDSVKHINSAKFDGVVDYTTPQETAPPAFAGAMLEEILTSDGLLDPRNFGPTATELQRLGVPQSVTRFMRKVQRKAPLLTDDLEAVHNFSDTSLFNLAKNSAHLRRGGAHWVAEFVQPENGTGFFEEHGSEVGKLLVSIIQALEALPDAGNSVTRWIKRSDPRSANKKGQPASHTKIARWVRGNKAIVLSDQELVIAQKIDRVLTNELFETQKAGIIIGDIRQRGIDGYLPQIWDTEIMRANTNEFAEGFSRWFEKEAAKRSEERRVGKECRSRWSPYH